MWRTTDLGRLVLAIVYQNVVLRDADPMYQEAKVLIGDGEPITSETIDPGHALPTGRAVHVRAGDVPMNPISQIPLYRRYLTMTARQ